MALVVLPKQLMVDGSGNPRSGAKAYFYQSGTTTPITVYTTSAYSVAHSNPVIANASGLFPAVYINPAVNPTYKLVVKDASDVEIYSEDNVPALGFTQADVGATLYPRTSAEQAQGVVPVNYYFPTPELWLSRYGVAGDGVTVDTTALRNALKVAAASGKRVIFDGRTYLVDGYIPHYSGQQWIGVGEDTLIQLSGNHAGVVSANYVSALGAGITGRGHIEGIRIRGAGSGANEYGLILRDYYTTLRRVCVENCFAGGIKLTHQNDAGSSAGITTLVENRLEACVVRNCGGILYELGASGNGALTDGWMINCVAQASKIADGDDLDTAQHLYCGQASGWRFMGNHYYGRLVNEAIELVAPFKTRMIDEYIESCFDQVAVRLTNCQEGCKVWADIDFRNASSGAIGVRCSRSGAFSNVPLDVDLQCRLGTNSAIGLYLANSGFLVRKRIIGYGANSANLTPVSGASAANDDGIMDADMLLSGDAAPEGNIAAPVGTLYARRSGFTRGFATYAKQEGTGTTGWARLLPALELEVPGYDPPSIPAGAQSSATTHTVPGARAGDYVICSFSLNLSGVQVFGYVSAADTVSVIFRNGTGSAVDLGSGTLRIIVIPRN